MIESRWIVLGVLFLVRISIGFQFQSVASVSPFLVDQLSISYAEVGTLIGLFMLPGVVIALPSGLLGTCFGDKRVCVVGLVLMVFGGVLMGFGQTYTTVFAGRLLSGIGAVLFNVILTKMVTD
jgi:predicted MFS family arabinose efflux permease